MEVDLSGPRITHILRFSLGAPAVSARAELADLTVYAAGDPMGRSTLSDMIQKSGALAGINADFAPFTGDPLGAMVRAGELISKPYPKRAALGWGEKVSTVAVLAWKGTVSTDGEILLNLNGLNEECPVNGATLNTTAAGLALAKTPNLYAIIRCPDAKWRPTGSVEGEFDIFYTDIESMPIQPGNVVIAARGRAMSQLLKLKRGQKVTIHMETTGMNWDQIDNVIGGGPFLVRSGKEFVDWESAGFKEAFTTKRHPRSAVGRTALGELLFVAVDGRQEMSDGATLSEMAEIMLRLGCVDAINLDGGGSTTVSVYGHTVNRPSDGMERPICNAVLIFGGPMERPEGLVIRGPKTVAVGGNAQFMLLDSEAKPIPHSQVIWTANGAGWVDQGGLLRGLRSGSVMIGATHKGSAVSLPVVVENASQVRKKRD